MGSQGRTITESGIASIPNYTKEERKKIDAGMWSHHCPNCGHFWLRDYGFPIRRCPSCGKLKLWADDNLVGGLE
ncbi:MAG: hypothetical protein KAS32_01945 [Candidatus Peribacteraceae bacterium]|nr:hypothetical protein [Candidatus Peribacteraceae bacterium]